MRKFTLLFAMVLFVGGAFAQTTKSTPATKGSGETFYLQTFDWGNPADPKGWTAPDGFYFEDFLDVGFNWEWWPPGDSLNASWTHEPALQSNTPDDGYLCNFVDLYNTEAGTEQNLDNTVVFPPFDCSDKTSVIVRYLTHFMCYSVSHMYLEISVDDWVHSAIYDVSFGTGHKDRPNDAAPGQPAVFEANITDVAAGMPNVLMKLHWLDTRLYFWLVDDFELAEAYDNDLRIKHFTVEWDNGDPNSKEAFTYMIPKSQLDGTGGYFNWEASVMNFGEMDQEDVYLDLTITKNNEVIWEKTTDPWFVVPILEIDTAQIADKFVPEDFGHYKVHMDFKQTQEEQTPENDEVDFFFHVTDSIYSRSDDTSELAWSMTFESYATDNTSNEDYFSGSIFPIRGDCEVNSISVYIQGGLADGLIEYQFQLYYVPVGEEDETPIKWLVSPDIITLDSSMFNTWVTLPFDKDGESEFLKAGDLVYAGISQWNWHENHLLRRNYGLQIGTDRTVQQVETSSVSIYEGGIRTGLGDFFGKRNLMCRLNINDHSNIIDNVDVSSAISSLGQNYPNPFKQTTEISYELANGSNVMIEVMDLSGRQVMEVNEGFKPAGKHTKVLNVGNLDAGIYFYTLKADGFTETKRMIVSD